jgi:glutamate synthase domain-containing protein 3
VLDPDGGFGERCNQDLVNLEKIADPDEADEVRELIAEHHRRTGSPVAAELLDDWDAALVQLVRVMPRDYERVLQRRAQIEQDGGRSQATAEAVSDNSPERAPREQVGA